MEAVHNTQYFPIQHQMFLIIKSLNTWGNGDCGTGITLIRSKSTLFYITSKVWDVEALIPSTDITPILPLPHSISSGLQHTDWEWQVIVPHLKVRTKAITRLSLGGRHPSPIRGVTWPSEGDDVMYEAGLQHKVKLPTLSLRAQVDRVFAQTRRQALGMQARLSWVISGTDGEVTILRRDLIDEWKEGSRGRFLHLYGRVTPWQAISSFTFHTFTVSSHR